ncbi:Inactive selenide, water dikinase-like protein [Pseudolycoriella hygida]|uniref:Inactive selenide, water dikinase-like protein n=1 Tax=Pseudolycoriella hygida TaxID=35572 RepID=A0A9Q0N6D0_9DIPT|nr:Inactive selenide, water dikinase-like protein [Pseudolycoriella hygida]
MKNERIGIGMDSAVIPIKRHGLSLVQSVDCFYPLIDDPYNMGKIAFANVVSDIYATGVTTIDTVRLVLSTPDEFSEEERNIVVPMMINGFRDAAKHCGCELKMGNIAINPWCLIGGVATSICRSEEIVMPISAQSGDVLILTKPLGTQLATNAYIWMKEASSQWTKLNNALVTSEQITIAYNKAVESMITLNSLGAKLMHKYNAHAATDITGFGLLGHAANLAKYQKLPVDFVIERLPLIVNLKKMAEVLEQKRLMTGKGVETSGGLLVAIDQASAKAFCDDYLRESGNKCWVIGRVTDGTGAAYMSESSVLFEVE